VNVSPGVVFDASRGVVRSVPIRQAPWSHKRGVVMSFSFGPEVRLDQSAYIDPTARIFGRVSAGEGSSFWPYSVIRAEGAGVRLGRGCNVQDGAVIHVGGGRGTVIGDYCSIAHRAVVHGAEVGDDCLIGIGAVVMDGAKVGRRCVVGAMALVPPGAEIPDGSVVMGIPCSHDNPELLRIDDPEVIRDLIAVSAPVPGHIVAQERQHCDAEVLEGAVALVVGGMSVHQPP